MTPQQTIAHYRITAKLGEGGMGEVYRATDTKLGRDVAIKILPDAFAKDPDRMARFAREAQVLASLNHPNIAAIYGVEERALVMELVEGPTLAERVAQRTIPFEEALPLIQQIVDALEYAHERGIIHRDLKPANIKITPEGRVKVLDFGLASVVHASAGESADPASSPTLTIRATMAGTIIGTAAYMSPEQARGQSVDKRADIWAFGVVLCEMLTGQRLFAGPTISDTLAAILKTELDLSVVPAQARKLVRLCLVRDPRLRLRDIGDARVLLADGPGDLPAPAGAAPPKGRLRLLPWAIACLALAVAGALLWRATWPAEHPLMRLSVDLGPDAFIATNTSAVISPDGTRLVFVARVPGGVRQLATRLLDQPKAVLLAGSENAAEPFFSPDGQWIGFFAAGKMKKISVQGGAAVTLCEAPIPRGGSWGEDGRIIVSLNSAAGLSGVSSAGGKPETLTEPATRGEITHRWPQVLPGGQAVLFTANVAFNFEDASIDVLSLRTRQWKPVLHGGYFGRYLPSGHLVYMHQGTLFGVPFDIHRLEVKGTPSPLLEDVANNVSFGSAQFEFSGAPSGSGTFVYLSGRSVQAPLMWLDQAGKLQPLVATPGAYVTPRFSPDGKRLALTGAPAGPNDIWVYDTQRDRMVRLSIGGSGNLFPVWTPDGKHIAFSSQGGGDFAMWWVRADGAGEPRRLIGDKTNTVRPYSFSPDGRRLAYFQVAPGTGADLWTLPLDTTDPEHPQPGKPELFLRTPAAERFPAFSPDGRWIAYSSTETGSEEIYVRPFPPGAGSGGRWQISTGGGLFPIWSRNGRELFYESLDYRIMVAEYTAKGDSFDAAKPRLWSDQPLANTGVISNFDLAPDGKRFVVVSGDTREAKASVHLTFLLNFFDELKRKMP